MKKIVYIFFLLTLQLRAQQNLPLNRQFGLPYTKLGEDLTELKMDVQNAKGCSCDYMLQLSDLASPFKPYLIPSIHQEKGKSHNLFYRKFKKENLFIVNDSADKFHIAVDPLFNFVFDNRGEALYKKIPISVNTRGFLVRGSIGEKLAFESSFYENQATYAKYIDNYIASTNNLFPQSANYSYDVIPGQGRAKKFKTNGYDFAMASGYVSYLPVKYINIQVGHGKHFVGDGYRSLLLSDNSFNYPYARITTTFKNIQYTNLYTSFMNLTDGGVKTPSNTERLFQKKVGSFQMLSVNLWKHLQLGLFQGMIWQAADSTNQQHLNFNTFNPLIGVNAFQYGLKNKNNVLLGSTFKLKITESVSLYGQCMLDEIGSGIHNKYGYQLGFKYYDLFTIKNLHLQTEYNTVRPYAYASANPQQNYSHYNQSLANPLGANFKEFIGIINYRIKDFFVEGKINYFTKGMDSNSFNNGGNVFKSDNTFSGNQNLSNVYTTQGVKTTVTFQDVHFGYLINPVTNLNVVIGLLNRFETINKTNNNTQFVYLGIRTSMSNFYYDF